MHGLGSGLLFLLLWTNIPVGGIGSTFYHDHSITTDSTKEKNTVFQYFEKLPFEELTITFDFDSLKARLYEDEYLPATLSYQSDLTEETWEIELRPRGRFRRKICDFPPLKVKFKKNELERRGLKKKHNKLKIVTHCDEEYDDKSLVLREYLVYKLYNQISDKSYRVRHFKIKWIDQKTGDEISEQWAFFIEEDEELAKRLDGQLYGFKIDESYSVDHENHTLLPLFQYMIGNHDHSIAMANNVELIKRKSDGKLIVVPYDFDYSGIVNAPYTYADPLLKLRDKRDRRFLGECTDDQLVEHINFLNEQESNLIAIINDFKDIPRKHRRDIVGYLKSYFDIVDEGMPERVPQD